MTQSVTVLVNSSDGFQDCWGPFFRLLEIYWPGRTWPALLNTEVQACELPQVDVRSSRVAFGEPGRLSWSDCLIKAIDQVETPLILYMQEDYFLDRPVNEALLAQCVETMLRRPEIGHIGLTKHGSVGPHLPYDEAGLLRIRPNARYRISTQAGLWRTGILRSYLEPGENGWMFEIYGTRRAAKRNDLFLTIDTDKVGPAIDYTHTGIIKGSWHPAIPELFERHGIDVDFTKRGFYRKPHPLLRKWALLRKLASDPARAIRNLLG